MDTPTRNTRMTWWMLMDRLQARGTTGLLFAIAVTASMASTLVGCDRKDNATPAEQAGQRPTMVATVGMLAEPARVIAGERVEVKGLLGEGVDPHTYKASPMDLRVLTSANTVISVGHNLEGQLGEALTKLQSRVKTVRIAEKLDPAMLIKASEAGKLYDPHVWNDVALMRKVASHVRDELVELSPAHAAEINANYARYDEVLAALDGYLKELMATIPPSRRVLVTAHDAFGYLGRAYGLEVLAIQGISTESEASLQDINAIVELVSTRKVPAVFVESSVPRKTIEALVEGCKARGHAVIIGGELYSDSLGPSGSSAGTYVGMMVHNAQAIAKALGSREAAASVAMPKALSDALQAQGAK